MFMMPSSRTNSNNRKSSSNGVDVDTLMSGGQIPLEFSSLPMNVDSDNFDDGIAKLYAPLDTRMSDEALADENVSMPLSRVESREPPPEYRSQPAASMRSTLAEFMKRRDLPQLIVEKLEDFLHILTPDGRLMYLSPSCKALTGYLPEELRGKFIIDFIHQDDTGIFMREFNESIASGSPFNLFYRFRRPDGSYAIFECRGHPHYRAATTTFDSNQSQHVCEAFFMAALPYPQRNSALLDSFLEHKIENERLTKRINELKREEAEEAKEELKQWQRKQNRRSSVSKEVPNATGGSQTILPLSPNITTPAPLMPMPPTQPIPANSGRRGSTKGGSGANHIESIELLTGLQYQEGERSQGISTGGQSPVLARGDAGIAMPMNREPKGTDKKKKIKVPEEYVCTDCGMFPPS